MQARTLSRRDSLNDPGEVGVLFLLHSDKGVEECDLASCSVAEALAQVTEASRPRAAKALAVAQGAAQQKLDSDSIAGNKTAV